MAEHEKTEHVRLQIIEATDNILYHKGYNLMSFSDIAEASGIPRGNLNYHFKTKHEILSAVIEHRLQKMKSMLEDWDKNISTPIERLKRFTQIPINELENVIEYGCPMGSLNTELGKVQKTLQSVSQQQFDMFRQWLRQQFQKLVPQQNADNLAMHLLVRSQGLAVMSHIYQDEKLVKREVESISIWLDSLKQMY